MLVFKSSVVGITDRSLLNQVSESGSHCAASYRELLQQIHVVSGSFLFIQTRCFTFFSIYFARVLLLHQFDIFISLFVTVLLYWNYASSSYTSLSPRGIIWY